MLDFEKDINEKEMKKYKKKNIYGPIVLLIFILCILGYILFGPDGVLSYLPKNVGEVITDKQIEEMKREIEKEREKEQEKNNENTQNNEEQTQNK